MLQNNQQQLYHTFFGFISIGAIFQRKNIFGNNSITHIFSLISIWNIIE